MAIRDKLRQNVAPYLQPGETVQAAFSAQTASPYLALISFWIIIFKNSYRVVAVTDRRIFVCQAARMKPAKITALIAEFPRSTRIGPAKGLWYQCNTLGDRLYIHKRYHHDVEAADAAASGAPS